MAEIGSNADIKELLDASEMDSLRNTLVAVLLENTDMDTETIYSLVFHEGRKILWC